MNRRWKPKAETSTTDARWWWNWSCKKRFETESSDEDKTDEDSQNQESANEQYDFKDKGKI